MKLKLNETGAAVVQDGKPVYIYDDGREAAVDVPGLSSKYSALSSDLDGLRSRATKAEQSLASLGASPEEISAALETHKNVKANKLVEAGKVDEAIAVRLKEAQAAWDTREAEYKAKLQEGEGRIYKLLVSQRFASSKALEDTFLTPDIAEAYWGRQFKVNGEQVIGHYPNGQPIYSAAKPGEPADFDEALSILKSAHPNKDKWTKSANATGSGAPGSNGNGNGGKTLTRLAFDQLNPAARMKFAKEGGAVVD